MIKRNSNLSSQWLSFSKCVDFNRPSSRACQISHHLLIMWWQLVFTAALPVLLRVSAPEQAYVYYLVSCSSPSLIRFEGLCNFITSIQAVLINRQTWFASLFWVNIHCFPKLFLWCFCHGVLWGPFMVQFCSTLWYITLRDSWPAIIKLSAIYIGLGRIAHALIARWVWTDLLFDTQPDWLLLLNVIVYFTKKASK